jgi:hypothetical protein
LEERRTRSEAMTPEYLVKPLTPFPLPTTDGWMLRTIGDAGAYILALPQKRKRLPTGNRSVNSSRKKPARLRCPTRFTLRCRKITNLMFLLLKASAALGGGGARASWRRTKMR